MQVDLTVKSLFDRSLAANTIVISIPVPSQTAKVTLKRSKGEAKYDGAAGHIRWTINKFSGQKEHSLSADVVLVSTTREKKPWSRCASGDCSPVWSSALRSCRLRVLFHRGCCHRVAAALYCRKCKRTPSNCPRSVAESNVHAG